MDPFSITIGVLSLATLCVQSSTSLYETIESFKSRKQDVRYLKAEVGDLNIVLQALEKNIEESTENFEVLRIILQHCNQACKDFEKSVPQVFRDSRGRLQEVKVWAKLQCLGSDIDKFRKLISSYKATMMIALADANLRTSRITKQLLEEYTEMTEDATSDLEEQIAELSAKLEQFQTAHSPSCSLEIQPGDDPERFKQARDQKSSLEQCVLVCHQLLDHIKEAKLSISENEAIKTKNEYRIAQGTQSLAPRLTADALKMCTYSLDATAQQLRDLRAGNRLTNGSDEAHVVQQLNSARHCLDVVEKAQYRINTFENIKIAEDSFSTAVSTFGDLIKARGLTIGARSVNIMGQMNDETLQKMTNSLHPIVPEKSLSMETSTTFEEKHGFGRTISGGNH